MSNHWIPCKVRIIRKLILPATLFAVVDQRESRVVAMFCYKNMATKWIAENGTGFEIVDIERNQIGDASEDKDS